MKLKDALWKESYDKPRQCIKNQRHHFSNKGPSSQIYGFSSSHVRLVKAMVFPVVTYGCESWTIQKVAAAAAAAKSLQSCPTLCDPIDGSPPGSSVSGILQARILEWVAISFSNAWKWKAKVKSLSRARLLVTPWTAAHQAPPSMGFFQARVLEWGAIAFSNRRLSANELMLLNCVAGEDSRESLGLQGDQTSQS